MTDKTHKNTVDRRSTPVPATTLSINKALAALITQVNQKVAEYSLRRNPAAAAIAEALRPLQPLFARRAGFDQALTNSLEFRRLVDELRHNPEELKAAIAKRVGPQLAAINDHILGHPDVLASFAEFWKQLDDNHKVSELIATRVLTKYKWFVSPSLPVWFIYKVVRIGRKTGNRRREINRLFVDYLTSNDYTNLSNIVESWASNPIFSPRMRILRSSVEVLSTARAKSNPRLVVLPTLISQIEGVITDYARANGLTKPPSFNAKGKKNPQTKWVDPATSQHVTPTSWLKGRSFGVQQDRLAAELLLEVLFQTAYPGVPLKNALSFSRHKILHGESLRYGTKENMMKAYLLLDFLASLR